MVSAPRHVVRNLIEATVRRLRPHAAFAAVTCAVFTLYAVLFAHQAPGPGNSDGYYSYLFARSLAFDGDLDLRNDYAICGDPWAVGRDRGTGHPDDQAYVGPAVFWTPILAVARRVVVLPANAPVTVMEGCSGPLARGALFSAVVVGALAIGLAYLTASRFTSRPVAAAAALLFAVASGLPHYATLFPSFSHVYGCFACALLVWASVRATSSETLLAFVPVGLAGGLLALQRLSDACLVVIPLVLIATGTRDRRFKIGATFLVACGTLLGVGLTASLYRYLYGSPFVLPQGRNYLHLAHAHPLLALFAPHGGLLYATPIAYLGLVGIGLGLGRRPTRAFAVGALVAFLICLWVSASVLDWHGKGTFGARRLLVTTPVLIVFAALTLERLEPFVRRHASALVLGAALLLFGVPVIGSSLAVVDGKLPAEAGAPQSVQYGSGATALWHRADTHVGDLAILPVELVYALRFGLPMRTFRAATTDKFYRRSFHTLEWEPRTLPFSDPTALEASTGLVGAPEGAKLVATEAHVVFAAGWPFATDAELTLDADEGTNVGLDVGTFGRRCDLGTRAVDADALHAFRTLHWAIPEGCFDSGLVELRVRSDRPDRTLLRQLTFDDSHAYPPSY